MYGTPVPGYEAPRDTVAPAQRVTRALVSIAADAARDGRLHPPRELDVDVPARLQSQLVAIGAELGEALSPDDLVRLVAAWSQVFGMITFELFGQTANAITAHEQLFDATARTMGLLIGLEER